MLKDLNITIKDYINKTLQSLTPEKKKKLQKIKT